MAKPDGDLAYIADEQCNDQARVVALRPTAVALLPLPLARREHPHPVQLAIAMTADARWVHPDSVRARPQGSPWMRSLRQCVDAAVAVLTFAAQVAGVAFVIVLIARFGLR